MSNEEVKGSAEVQGTCAGQEPGPFIGEKGDVSYVAAFPGTFVSHTLEDARKNIEKFAGPLGRTLCIYRIEVIERWDPPAEEKA